MIVFRTIERRAYLWTNPYRKYGMMQHVAAKLMDGNT